MSLSIKVDPIEKVTQATLRADLSFEDQQKAAGDFVREGIVEADQTNQRILGRIPPKTITVDGKQGAPLDSVNPDGGQIIVEYELIGDVLKWIAQTLQDRSPVVSGEYKKGHTLFADGHEVPIDGQIPPAEEYAFTNLVPYARRIEVGKTKSGRAFVLQVENHIYERTAKDARSRFGNVADIQFQYRTPVGAYRLKHNQSARHFRKDGSIYIEPSQRADRVKGVEVSPPAIIVRLRKS